MSSPAPTVEAVWAAFASEHGLTDVPYKAWAFGVDPEGLASLVVRGVKTATASAFSAYALAAEPLPEVGGYNIILNAAGQPVCIIRTTSVVVTPFADVSENHAWQEGEGDRTLTYWRAEHRAFFAQNGAELGYEFTDQMPVVCETFEVVHRIIQTN